MRFGNWLCGALGLRAALTPYHGKWDTGNPWHAVVLRLMNPSSVMDCDEVTTDTNAFGT